MPNEINKSQKFPGVCVCVPIFRNSNAAAAAAVAYSYQRGSNKLPMGKLTGAAAGFDAGRD